MKVIVKAHSLTETVSMLSAVHLHDGEPRECQ